MKSNIFKYIFIIFVIIIVVVAFFVIRNNESEQETREETTSTEKEIIRQIRLGIAQCDTLNPLLTTNKNVQDITKLIYEPLVDISSDYKADQQTYAGTAERQKSPAPG